MFDESELLFSMESMVHCPSILKAVSFFFDPNKPHEINVITSAAAIHAAMIFVFILQVFNCDELKRAGLQ
jgi:hypothetical protein